MKTLTDALARGLAAGALPVLLLWLAERSLNPEQGPDIGGPVILLVTLVVIPFVWAHRDGATQGGRHTIVVWCLAAVVPWLADALRVFVDNAGRSVDDALGCLVAGLFLVPFFLVGAVVGSLVGAARRASGVTGRQ